MDHGKYFFYKATNNQQNNNTVHLSFVPGLLLFFFCFGHKFHYPESLLKNQSTYHLFFKPHNFELSPPTHLEIKLCRSSLMNFKTVRIIQFESKDNTI